MSITYYSTWVSHKKYKGKNNQCHFNVEPWVLTRTIHTIAWNKTIFFNRDSPALDDSNNFNSHLISIIRPRMIEMKMILYVTWKVNFISIVRPRTIEMR
jgi:hypothetical protein